MPKPFVMEMSITEGKISMKTIIMLAKDRRGAGAVEYGLLAALIVLGGLSALDSMKQAANHLQGTITVGLAGGPAPKVATTSTTPSPSAGASHAKSFHIADDGTITETTR